MIRTNCTLFLTLLLTTSSALGQKWARDMFDHTSHDFGTVARGAKVEHTFTLENIYEEQVHIAAIRTSCGCTVPKVTQRTLKTWEKARITAMVDTRGYYGRKDATVTVVFDLPFPAEVRLNIHTYIRSDIVVQPGSVQFGSVAEGAGARKKVTVSYAGRKDWEIVKVETGNPHLAAQTVKVAEGVPGRATYELVVDLKKDAPVGYLHDHLILVTNDLRARWARVPVAVEGVVVAAVSVRPSPLTGVVQVGETLVKRLFVQGRQPFRILAAGCDDQRLTCTVPQAANTLHLISVTFTAGETPGKVKRKIRIETDLAGNKVLEVPVDIRVMPRGPMAF